MAVALTDGPGSSKRMCTGAEMSGAVFVDLLGGRNDRILIPENGTADFPVNGGSVAVWVPESMAEQIRQALKSEALPEAPLSSI